MIKVEPMIRIAGVSKTFSVKDNKVEALKNVSLDIAKGDIYGIIGMSGAGKSTLVRCLNFLERPTEGTAVSYTHLCAGRPGAGDQHAEYEL